MGQHRTNVNLAPVVVNRGNQPGFIPADVEHGQSADLVCARKDSSQISKGCKVLGLDQPVPMLETRFRIWMFRCVIVEPLSGDDVHKRFPCLAGLIVPLYHHRVSWLFQLVYVLIVSGSGLTRILAAAA